MFVKLIDREPLIAMREAAKFIAARTGGKKPALATLHRWALRGVAGRRLETVAVGHQRWTSEAAILRFLHREETEPQAAEIRPSAPARLDAAADVAALRQRLGMAGE